MEGQGQGQRPPRNVHRAAGGHAFQDQRALLRELGALEEDSRGQQGHGPDRRPRQRRPGDNTAIARQRRGRRRVTCYFDS